VDRVPPIRVGIDQGANLRELKKLQRRGLIELRQANELEKRRPHVVQQKKGFTLGYSRLGGPDVLADDLVHEVERIIGLANRLDIGHFTRATSTAVRISSLRTLRRSSLMVAVRRLSHSWD